MGGRYFCKPHFKQLFKEKGTLLAFVALPPWPFRNPTTSRNFFSFTCCMTQSADFIHYSSLLFMNEQAITIRASVQRMPSPSGLPRLSCTAPRAPTS
jgi:hypothetical protein